jgi:hypothetical protein
MKYIILQILLLISFNSYADNSTYGLWKKMWAEGTIVQNPREDYEIVELFKGDKFCDLYGVTPNKDLIFTIKISGEHWRSNARVKMRIYVPFNTLPKNTKIVFLDKDLKDICTSFDKERSFTILCYKIIEKFAFLDIDHNTRIGRDDLYPYETISCKDLYKIKYFRVIKE